MILTQEKIDKINRYVTYEQGIKFYLGKDGVFEFLSTNSNIVTKENITNLANIRSGLYNEYGLGLDCFIQDNAICIHRIFSLVDELKMIKSCLLAYDKRKIRDYDCTVELGSDDISLRSTVIIEYKEIRIFIFISGIGNFCLKRFKKNTSIDDSYLFSSTRSCVLDYSDKDNFALSYLFTPEQLRRGSARFLIENLEAFVMGTFNFPITRNITCEI